MRYMKLMVLLAAVGAMLLSGPGSAVSEQQGATNLGPIVNGPDSDFGPIVTADGNALYFTSDRPGGFGGQDIWMSRRANGEWTAPVNLGDQINTKYNEGPDTFSVDERVMFFTRCDKVEDLGACDIYTANWDEIKKQWVGVKNLGPNINSRYNDANASLSYDGGTLYARPTTRSRHRGTSSSPTSRATAGPRPSAWARPSTPRATSSR